MATIALIGDSVLDNFYWLENKEHDLRYELMSRGFSINNYAVDESRLVDVIEGIIPSSVYQTSRSYPYHIDNTNGRVMPLNLLRNSHNDFIVCSVGGNDLRLNIMSLFFGVDAFINRTFTPDFLNNYDNLVKTLSTMSKVILVVVYIPYLGKGSPYAMINGMQDNIYKRIRSMYYNVGRKYNIPVVDLSLTFDPYIRSHYGTTEIEPSNLSNIKIAQLIDYVIQNYNGYKVYYAPKCGNIIAKIF